MSFCSGFEGVVTWIPLKRIRTCGHSAGHCQVQSLRIAASGVAADDASHSPTSSEAGGFQGQPASRGPAPGNYPEHIWRYLRSSSHFIASLFHYRNVSALYFPPLLFLIMILLLVSIFSILFLCTVLLISVNNISSLSSSPLWYILFTCLIMGGFIWRCRSIKRLSQKVLQGAVGDFRVL